MIVLTVHLGSELSVRQHVIAKAAATCYCHLRCLRLILRRIGRDRELMSNIDYCN